MISLIVFTAIVATIGYLYIKFKLTYWKRIGLEQIEPVHLIYGNAKDFITRNSSFGDCHTKLYNNFKSRGLKHGGIYVMLRPTYMPLDLDIIKNILQKDFNNFVNHGFYVNEEVDPLTGHLFALEDDKWRRLRTKLTPTFTSGKMKMMFSTMVACTEGLREILTSYAKLQDAVDMKEVASRFTTDVIGSVAFGIDCNSLKNPDSEFRQFGRKIFTQTTWTRIRSVLATTIPRHFLTMIKFKQMNPEVEDFFMGVVDSTVNYREKNNIYRKDFMHLLLQLKNRGKVADDHLIFSEEDSKTADGHFLTFNELAAQCFVFFIAGFETSATTMTFALLELALNPDIQESLRQEITSVLKKHDNQVTYEAVMDMHYLDKVIHETLRKHPPLPGTPRMCNKEYQVPGTDVVLELGTKVHIPFQAIHRDPEYYPDPEKFDPERFSEENKAKRHPFAFIPFGEGPRICIGARFGMLQAKVGVASVIKNFNVTLNKKTKVPIKYTTKSFITAIDGDVWLTMEELS
ncbi:unnamed protein product [Diabrotica balteata]|uniref:Cytochrome P450 n=1 Tax=Diabrotica balteata TaxID=107213 RepID=A0A9N9XA77_DIABA|nr:unnamed protein product [Diabrotica balteata]